MPQARLGAGTYGVVYRARDLELLRPVAVKVFPARLTRPERFLREAQLQATLRHPNLVAIYQADRVADAFYLVMELIEGEPLSRWAQPGERDALPLLLDVADALEEVHRADLVHRDVKPGNIQVRPDGTGVLLDLGCVYDARGATLTRTGMVLGTGNYLPPEAFRGAPPTPAWDWYSWGVTLYACLEGETPYTVAELLDYAQGGALPPLRLGAATRRAGLDRLVAACLDRDDAARPSSRRALEDLAGPRAGRSTTATRPLPVTAPVPSPAPPPRRRLASLAPLLVLLCLGLGALSVSDPPAAPPPPEAATPSPAPAPPGIAWDRERGGPLLLPSPNAAPSHRVPVPCEAPEGKDLVGPGRIWVGPGGEVLGYFGSGPMWMSLYRGTPPRLVALARPSRPVRLLPRGAGGLWALHPEHLGNPEDAPAWDPVATPPDPAGCLAPVPIAGEPEADLAWRVARALLPTGQPLGPPTSLGDWAVHDVWPEHPGAPRQLLFNHAGGPPRVMDFPEEAGWRPSAPLALEPGTDTLVWAHRHAEAGVRVRRVDLARGAAGPELAWPGARDAGPFVGPAGLYFWDGEAVRRVAGNLPGTPRAEAAVRRLADDPEWIPPHDPEGVALVAGAGAVHAFVPHRLRAGPNKQEVPVLSWYRLAPDLSGPVPPRAWRLRVPRPPEAVLLDQRVEVAVRPVPGRPDQALVTLQIGWSSYELLLVDLARARVLHRLDVTAGDVLRESGYLRADPVLTAEAGGVRARWVDLWGQLKTWDLPGTPPGRGRGP